MLEQLRKAGLSGNEAKAYHTLLNYGKLSAYSLARKISMDRTLAYTVLNHLIERGLISYTIQEKKKIFKAESPENLLNPIKAKGAFIADLIPELNKIRKLDENPSEINIYEGKQGVRTFARLLMKHKKVCSFGATGSAYDLLYESPVLAKNMAKSGLYGKIIASPSFKKHPLTKMKNMKIKYLDLQSNVTTSIFGDYVAIHLIKPKPFIILIKNKEIADSYQKHFEVLWQVAYFSSSKGSSSLSEK